MAWNIPHFIRFALQRLEEHGFDAYLVGGCVRDLLRGAAPHDWDLCTNARPREILACFPDRKTVTAGIQHGTVGVVLAGRVVEITTFRVDGAYSDGRHPDRVDFTGSLTDDLRRRDFTVNAMAYHPQKGVIDPFGGEKDLRAGVLRCVGCARRRFSEDALRILRGLRFAATLGFSVEEETAAAMLETRGLLPAVARERIRTEWERTLLGQNAGPVLAAFFPVVSALFPVLAEHAERCSAHRKAWEHMAASLEKAAADLTVRWVLFLLPVYTRHGPEPAKELLLRLGYGQKQIMGYLRLLQRQEAPLPADPAAMKRALGDLGPADVQTWIAVQQALTAGRAEPNPERMQPEEAEALLRAVLERGECYCLNALAVTGKDLLALGVKRGPCVGNLLRRLLDLVVEGTLENRREALLHWVGTHLGEVGRDAPGP